MKDLIRKMIRIYGIVQGVGFRPFVSRLAMELGVCGSVCNKGPYVEVFAEADADTVAEFIRRLRSDAPARSLILKILDVDKEVQGDTEFRIIESEKERGEVFVSPDIATCPECRRELFDPTNRRYLHPFINCTACGPRLTILDSMPYDRVRTSMGEFPMCPQCEAEYTDPATRRYHAQPVCCNDCGPELYTLDGHYTGNLALMCVRDVVRNGGIAAIKGIGGFHLCVDATNEDAVRRLRTLKNRPFKAFALMMRDLETVKRECVIRPGQEEILTGPQKPILLLERRQDDPKLPKEKRPRVTDLIAPENPTVGVMLPYAPVQMLLFDFPDGESMPDCLVMTSGNPSGAPICRTDDDAREWLQPLCDVILSNDRKIRLRADDSVMDWLEGKPYMIRRSRGYAPLPFLSSIETESRVLGIGGELKNTFCLATGDLYYTSPYIGDLADLRSVDALESAVERMEELLEIRPEAVACDMHPRYNSVQVAEGLGLPVIPVQHHYAHVLSCMLENDVPGPVIGVSFDGTGYGTDGTVWGGEFLMSDLDGFRRAGSIGTFVQAGGDLASREGWRVAAALILQAQGESAFDKKGNLTEAGKQIRRLRICGKKELQMLDSMLRSHVNCVRSTSCGRLFDAASAILGFRRESTCEGEASMVLEFAAERYEKRVSRQDRDRRNSGGGSRTDAGSGLSILTEDGQQFVLSDAVLMDSLAEVRRDGDLFRIPEENLIRYLTGQMLSGSDPERLAYDFHLAVSSMILEGCRACRRETGCSLVCLTGGVMQNRLLVRLTKDRLQKDGFTVLLHSLLPPNDGGIAPGQALAGMMELERKKGNR